ncbi:MAG: threonine dehydrogenase-like Zn-dependent dehydrogenase [Pseudohongiellaceae bacterium]|jgi:threonine dehydrogenase-like Zn-dependent dehydrogenase
MRGLQLNETGAAVRDDLAEPEGRAGWSTVAVTLAGVCATDIALSKGYMGFSGIPGHEFVGRALDGPFAGQRVVGEINAGCGSCDRCVNGDPRHCSTRTVLGILAHSGAFAERLSLPNHNLLLVPDSVSDDAASFAEPLAAALAISEAVDIAPGTRALVAGDGRLGLLCAHALHWAGAAVTVAGRHNERAALLPEGVPLVTGLLEGSADQNNDAGADANANASNEPFALAVEATGNPDVLDQLVPRMAPQGTIVLKTTSERPLQLDTALIVVNELRLVGSRCGRFAPALQLLADGAVPVEAMVQARYPLAQADAALAHAARPGVLKVLVDIAAT